MFSREDTLPVLLHQLVGCEMSFNRPGASDVLPEKHWMKRKYPISFSWL